LESEKVGVAVIGRAAEAIDYQAELLLDGVIVAMQNYDTETLRAVADRREEINPGGWMTKMIREYVDVWR
jgi:hypothetical protein